MKKAAEIIMECLKKKGLSQRQLAERMNEDVRVLNQQLKRQADIKTKRFADVMQYIGYTIDISDAGCQRVSKNFGKRIIEAEEPKGMFWYEVDGKYVAIANIGGEMFTESFNDWKNCSNWMQEKTCVDELGYLHFET